MRLVALLILFAGSAACAQQSVDVSYLGNREYTFGLTFVVPASSAQVYSLLTDFERLQRLNSSIQRSEVIAKQSVTTRVRLIAKVCILFMCKDVTTVEDIHFVEPQRELYSEVVSALSEDIEAGHTTWKLQPVDEGTLVSVSSFVRFSFWVPPFIGPLAIKRELSKNLDETVSRIQQIVTESSAGIKP